MSIVNSYENVVDRSSSGEIRNSPTYSRTFTVRCDHPDTSMVDIANAPGIKYGDPHPHDGSCFVTNIDVDADGDSMLIYTVGYRYTRPVGDLAVTGGTPDQPEDGTNSNSLPDPLQVPQGYWSGGSSLETKHTPYLPITNKPIEMTNGRPLTTGVLVDYASELLTMTNYYSDFASVQAITSSVDYMNSDTWPVGANEIDYGYLAWKIISCNWSFRQQVSNQQRLSYYEVNVTLQRKARELWVHKKHVVQGWPAEYEPSERKGAGWMPGWIPRIASAGFQALTMRNGQEWIEPMMVQRRYKDCEGEDINQDELDEDECKRYPKEVPTTEELPLTWNGRDAREPNAQGDIIDPPCIIVPWTEDKVPIPFHDLFGDGPPFAPTKFPKRPIEPEFDPCGGECGDDEECRQSENPFLPAWVYECYKK